MEHLDVQLKFLSIVNDQLLRWVLMTPVITMWKLWPILKSGNKIMNQNLLENTQNVHHKD